MPEASSKRISRDRRLRLPIALLSLLLLLGAAIAAITGVRSLDEANRSLEHSYRVIHLLTLVEASVQEGEAKARGYRNTGRERFRQQYAEAITRATEENRRLVALTADNPVQQERAKRYHTLMMEHLRTMEILFDPAAMTALDDSRWQQRIDANLRRMDRLVELRTEMQEEESVLLEQRRKKSHREATTLTAFIVVSFAAALILLGFLLTSLARENRRNRRLERDARSAVNELREALEFSDTLSEQLRAQSTYAGMLQSCQSREEIVDLTARAIASLVPGASGRCYLSRPSQNFLENAGDFGERPISSNDLLTQEQCWALRRGQPYHVSGRNAGPRCVHIDPEIEASGLPTLCIPLVAQGQSLGLLYVSAPEGRQSGNDAEVAMLNALAEQMAMTIANLQLRETLRVQSIRDPLTSLFNRRYLEESMARELQRCARRNLPLSVLMLDIDKFKHFNDTYGHVAGDALLGMTGRLIQSRTRADDIACRYGGEEFTVVMPEVDATTACTRAEAIRAAIEIATVQHLGQPLGPVTISIGVATFPGDGDTPELLLRNADSSLYRAKDAGRNRVMHHSLSR